MNVELRITNKQLFGLVLALVMIGAVSYVRSLDTSQPWHPLGQMAFTDALGTSLMFETDSGGSSGLVLRTASNPSAGEPIFIVESSGHSERLRVEHDGALKTSNYLEVDGTGNSYIMGNLGIGTSTVSNTLTLADDGDISGVDQIIGYNDIRLYGDSSGGPDVFITADGKVGIGTTAPVARVYVSGGSYETVGNANQAAYALGADSIAAGRSIYSYGRICVGNSQGNCEGSGGTVITSSSVSTSGDVSVGGTAIMGYQVLTAQSGWYSTLDCPAGKKVIGGGCLCTEGIFEARGAIYQSRPKNDGTGWVCECKSMPLDDDSNDIWAICARMG